MYFLLGHGINTCLVVAFRPNISMRGFLLDAFQQIRLTHSIPVPEGELWPKPQHLDLIMSTSARSQTAIKFNLNRSSVVRSIMAFVADPEHADPVSRLDWIVEVLSNHRHENALISDLLRERSLVDVREDIRPIVDRVLSFLMCHVVTRDYDWSKTILVHHLSQFLAIENNAIERALQIVNSFIPSCPLLFPTRLVLDFSFPDMPAHSITTSIYYPWRYIVTLDPQVWVEISARYIHWFNRLLNGQPSIGTTRRKLTPAF